MDTRENEDKKWIDYSMVFLANVNQHDLLGKPSIALEKMSASTHQEGKSDDNNDSVPNDHNGEKFFDAHLQSNRCFVLVTAKVWKANGKGDPIFVIAEPSTFKKDEASGKMVHWMPKDGLAKINIKTRKHEDGYFQVMYPKYPNPDTFSNPATSVKYENLRFDWVDFSPQSLCTVSYKVDNAASLGVDSEHATAENPYPIIIFNQNGYDKYYHCNTGTRIVHCGLIY